MVTWKQCNAYEEAENVTKCLYVFKKGDSYLYIGKAKRFGGPSGRYAYGYRYLVDALLASGATLFLAKLTEEQWESVKDYENTLISSCKGKKALNRQRVKSFKQIQGLEGP